jgi:hypothetical protein
MGKYRRLGSIVTIVAIALLAGALYLGQSGKGKIVFVRLLGTESTLNVYPLPGKTGWRPVGPKIISLNENANARQVTFGRALHTEPQRGERRWVLEGFSAGAGTPLVIIDPDTGEDIIYVGTYDRAVAMKTDGTVLWDVATGLPKPDPANPLPSQHSYGINYHMQTETLIAGMADGHVYVLDRKTGRALLEKPYMMPGARTKLTNFSLPASVAARANKDIAHMVGQAEAKGERRPNQLGSARRSG